jgi:hypothetical protein
MRTRSTRTFRGFASVALTCLAVAGCGEDNLPRALALRVAFQCDTDRERTELLRLAVTRGGCDGDVVFRTALERGDVPLPVPVLPSGRYGFQATALEGRRTLASDCVETRLPTSEPIELTLASDACSDADEPDAADEPDPSSEPMPSEDPDARPSPAAEDAGDDDAGTEDAAVSDDAGGENPCPGERCNAVDAAAPPGESCARTCAANEACQNGACRPVDALAANCKTAARAGSEYLVCPELLTWSMARQRCASWGFGLVAIDDAGENELVAGLAGKRDVWTAANDLGLADVGVLESDIQVSEVLVGSGLPSCRSVDASAGEGHWAWASASTKRVNERPFCTVGSTAGSACAPVGGAFTRFQSAQPDNAGCLTCVLTACPSGEDCGVLRGATGEWADLGCGSFQPFACERRP